MVDLKYAQDMHYQAWYTLLDQAGRDPHVKYGVYASRTLMVRHPEIYLMGDRWFYEGARYIKGFKECYREPSPLAWRHMEYGGKFFKAGRNYSGVPEGHPLSLREIRLDKYHLSITDRIYPDPILPQVDQRLLPLAVSLKAEGKVVTPLELVEMHYFRRLEEGAKPDELFMIYCADESAYLWDEGKLFSPSCNNYVSRISASPLLVFNERSVWHPLMDRDDRERDKKLGKVVSKLECANGSRTEPSPVVAELIPLLREVTSLDSDDQRLMAALASVRAVAWEFHPYFEPWTRFVPEDDFEIDISRRLCLIREFDRLANLLSPASAFLAAVSLSGSSLEEQMRILSEEYLIHTGVVREAEARGWKRPWRLEAWGHVWPCGLMEHTIDDAFRARTGHCVSQAHMIGAILELLDVPHVVVNFDRGGVAEGVNHHFVLSRDGRFLFDDGIVNFKGIDPPTEDYGPLLSFSAEGEWACTVGNRLYGNIPSARIEEWIEVIHTALAGRFQLRFFIEEEQGPIGDKEEFVKLLRQREVELIRPPI